jgi:hypothetical protein
LTANRKARLRSQSQLSNQNIELYNVFKRSASPAEAPINIFISVEKLNKMKINSSKRRKSSRKSELLDIYSTQKGVISGKAKAAMYISSNPALSRNKHPNESDPAEK